MLVAMNRPSITIPWRADGTPSPEPILRIQHWYPNECVHRPDTAVHIGYGEDGIALRYRVRDADVVCRYARYLEPVYKDSCVEFFVRPTDAPGYFNFEFNALGALLASYIEDPTRTADGFVKFTRLAPEVGEKVAVTSSWNGAVGVVDAGPVEWTLDALIPWTVLGAYCAIEGPPDPGSEWRGNFYKCGDETPHPHWGAWSDVGEKLDFHQPGQFGRLHFGNR